MAITFGQIKGDTLRLLDEYSSRGTVQSATKIADYRLKIQSLTNAYIYELASTTAKIPAIFNIVHNPVRNRLSDDTSSIRTHMPDHDFSASYIGAKAIYFESTGPATIYLEESFDGGETFSLIETIVIPADQTSFAEYKRLIPSTQPTNMVRLRFSGDYVYAFRNYVLYPYSWPTEEDIPQHRPYVEYPFPSDFFDIDSVFIKGNAWQFAPYSDYILTHDKKIAFSSYEGPLELICNYWRRPNLLVFTGNELTDDAQVIDLGDDAAIIIPWFVAGDILNSEQLLAAGTLRLNQAAVKRDSLVTNKSNYASTIMNVTGW